MALEFAAGMALSIMVFGPLMHWLYRGQIACQKDEIEHWQAEYRKLRGV